ncbi:MAG: 50S ribosomal protein L23 [Parcubacteria group bacterium ADurb.Bin326]|nr:MAG: 50S ribosomal protein L23 [Parcubacteria group bacterium ADurb.Bin326]
MGIFNKKKEEAKTEEVATKEEKKVVASEKPAKKTTKTSESKAFAVSGVLVAPLVTERASAMEQLNKYAFIVEASTNKIEIAKAFATRYGIMPEKVNISNYYGKFKRYGRNWGKTKDWKKAIISLPKGKSINVYEGVK